MALSADVLITWDLAQDQLKLEDVDETNTELVINAACEMANKYCRRKLAARDYSGVRFDGSGRSSLLVQYPIVSVDHLYVDISRAFGAGSEITDFLIYVGEGIIALPSSNFPRYPQCVKLDYRAGYEVGDATTPGNVPSDLQIAILEICAHTLRLLGGGGAGIRQVSGPDGMNTFYEIQSIPTSAERILEGFQDKRYAV
jgi:hypothetical protein